MGKLGWGLIGGGKGSQIGPAHRLGTAVDGAFSFDAGALDHNPEAGRAFATELAIAEDRGYGDWCEMLAGETARDDHGAGADGLVVGDGHGRLRGEGAVRPLLASPALGGGGVADAEAAEAFVAVGVAAA